jgi:hypothetical protein
MDSPERGTGASTSSTYDLPSPPSALDSLSSIQVSQIQTEIATELYGFAPLTFTSRVVDLANDVIYDVVDKIEEQVSKRWISTTQEEQDQERKDAVAKVGRAGAGCSLTRSKRNIQILMMCAGRQSTGNTPHGRRRHPV